MKNLTLLCFCLCLNVAAFAQSPIALKNQVLEELSQTLKFIKPNSPQSSITPRNFDIVYLDSVYLETVDAQGKLSLSEVRYPQYDGDLLYDADFAWNTSVFALEHGSMTHTLNNAGDLELNNGYMLEYDADLRITTQTNQSIYAPTSVYQDTTQIVNTYNTADEITEELVSVWDEDIAGWEWSGKTTITYMSDTLVTELTTENWDGELWQPAILQTYEYDNDDVLISQLNQEWNDGDQAYDDVSRFFFEYPHPDTSIIIFENWDDSIDGWAPFAIIQTDDIMGEVYTYQIVEVDFMGLDVIVEEFRYYDAQDRLVTDSLFQEVTGLLPYTYVLGNSYEYYEDSDMLLMQSLEESNQFGAVSITSMAEYFYTSIVSNVVEQLAINASCQYQNPSPKGAIATCDWEDGVEALASLYDLQGRLINQQSITKNAPFDLTSNAQQGIYFLNIQLENGTFLTQKVIVQ